MERNGQAQQIRASHEKMYDMNPNGFFEMEFTVNGINYNQKTSKILKGLREEEKSSFCKIVSQGLVQSDPQYIDKIVYMLRHPRAVAKSQERLTRMPKQQQMLNALKELSEDAYTKAIHTPEMFIKVTKLACEWLSENTHVPYIIVDYDSLVADPDTHIKRVLDFLGEGDFEKARKVVDKKLKRSNHEDIDHPLWYDAEYIYEEMKKENFTNIIEHIDNPYSISNQTFTNFVCVRKGAPTNLMKCRLCKQHKRVRDGFKEFAEKRKINWRVEPCAYECEVNADVETPITIQESIANNFWIDDE